MTDWSWKYPTLGFDPLPGDPAVVLSLKEDARIFGQRMTDEAARLERLAHRDAWQGEAADVFAEHVKTLPRDLRHCGEAFSNLAVSLGNYYDAFTRAKTQLDELERKAAAAKQKVQSAELACTTPVIQPPGACPIPRDSGPLNAAEDELGEILRSAHEFADKFNESAEIEGIADAIRRFTEFAPDEPRWNIIKKWAGDVFTATPVGAAVEAVHGLINHYAEFFSDLASLLSDLSGTLGLLSIPLLFVPPIGTAVAVGALATAAGSAAIKTSLYVGHARDANGNLYVNGGTLIRSYVDVGINAGGIGAAAGASKAAKVAEGFEATLGKEFVGQFTGKVLREAAGHPKELIALGREMGPKAAAKLIAKDTVRGMAQLPGVGKAWTVGGVGLSAGGPLVTATERHNYFGWHSAEHFFLDDFPNLLSDAPNSPDLQLRAAQRITPAPPRPVMGR